MIHESEKLQILNEILESPEFKDSKRYQALLQYLVKETLSGAAPKEITIGTDFFRKDAGFDPKEDPTVRVYLNNLRKKLDHYYLTTSNPHTYRLEIPKGHYQVEFIKVERRDQRAPASKLPMAAVIVSAIAILTVAGFLLKDYFPAGGSYDYERDPVWSEFVAPGGRPTLVLLGDFYFLYEQGKGDETGNFVRNINVNSPDDFKERVKKDPDFAEKYVQSNFTFLRPSASWGLAQILPVLQHSPNGFSLKLASQFSTDDLKTNNIIFLGSFKTLHHLQKFLHTFGLEYRLSPSRFTIQGDDAHPTKTFSPTDIKGGNYEKDYAVVAKGAGPEGGTILLLLGFADSGPLEASRAVTDPVVLDIIIKELAKEPSEKPFHFTLVVETEGINQAIFKSQVRYFTQGTSTRPLPQAGDSTAR